MQVMNQWLWLQAYIEFRRRELAASSLTEKMGSRWAPMSGLAVLTGRNGYRRWAPKARRQRNEENVKRVDLLE